MISSDEDLFNDEFVKSIQETIKEIEELLKIGFVREEKLAYYDETLGSMRRSFNKNLEALEAELHGQDHSSDNSEGSF